MTSEDIRNECGFKNENVDVKTKVLDLNMRIFMLENYHCKSCGRYLVLLTEVSILLIIIIAPECYQSLPYSVFEI